MVLREPCVCAHAGMSRLGDHTRDRAAPRRRTLGRTAGWSTRQSPGRGRGWGARPSGAPDAAAWAARAGTRARAAGGGTVTRAQPTGCCPLPSRRPRPGGSAGTRPQLRSPSTLDAAWPPRGRCSWPGARAPEQQGLPGVTRAAWASSIFSGDGFLSRLPTFVLQR